MNNWERDFRDAERNQELRRQNNLLEQQRWEQQEQNRLVWKQNKTLQERNELERQRQWNEESRHQRELELRKEQQFKDNIFDLKNCGPKLKLKMREGEFRYS